MSLKKVIVVISLILFLFVIPVIFLNRVGKQRQGNKGYNQNVSNQVKDDSIKNVIDRGSTFEIISYPPTIATAGKSFEYRLEFAGVEGTEDQSRNRVTVSFIIKPDWLQYDEQKFLLYGVVPNYIQDFRVKLVSSSNGMTYDQDFTVSVEQPKIVATEVPSISITAKDREEIVVAQDNTDIFHPSNNVTSSQGEVLGVRDINTAISPLWVVVFGFSIFLSGLWIKTRRVRRYSIFTESGLKLSVEEE